MSGRSRFHRLHSSLPPGLEAGASRFLRQVPVVRVRESAYRERGKQARNTKKGQNASELKSKQVPPPGWRWQAGHPLHRVHAGDIPQCTRPIDETRPCQRPCRRQDTQTRRLPNRDKQGLNHIDKAHKHAQDTRQKKHHNSPVRNAAKYTGVLEPKKVQAPTHGASKTMNSVSSSSFMSGPVAVSVSR